MSKSDKKVDPFKSFIAGGTAGAVEGVITYPFEFAKTRLQLVSKSAITSRNPLVLIYTIAKTQGVSALYVGCPAFVVGNTVKASVRFLGFDSIKALLADKNGKLSGPRGVIAGLGAGLLESVIAVTPFEAIKTALIDDKQTAKPKYQNGLVSGTVKLVKDMGFKGIYAGVVPVSLRQASNQAVRLGSYNAIKTMIQQAQGQKPTDPLNSGATFAVGSFAGIITVYTTMPIDTVKTRMQALGADKLYKSTIDCFVKIFKQEGLLTFWKGATPRLGRLVLSGGIVFTIYEKMLVLMG
ncbi:citrate transport protein [Spathaspora passalidarum NRRL Y-27907]|uniref:Mitochondrial thiamine pyrophosphate carrier 1 n=1 Tax=Spathaspora passalidarum (strain NRRL Y-27907 / 11-Y1) TaxID=619300 RepID=G3AQT9_SPAPN|nr:citrate transport protein [Spathaspora passalidarum NRRL Y-27907]EGW31636.1 citrate transport protein [Spathaspora passalidarum NRRL Y-27907]